MNRKKCAELFGGALGLLVVLGIIVVVQVIARQVPVRADLTEDRMYTLSDGTRQMLGGLDRDVTLKLYFSKSAENLAMPIKQYAQRITDLLREYESQSPHVVLEVYDPKPDSDEEEWAERYGLNGMGMGVMGESGRFYFGLVAVCGAQEAVIPFLDPSAEPRLEYLLTQLVHEVSQAAKPQVGVMSSLPVMGLPPMPYSPRQQGPPSWIILSELKKQYEVQMVDTSATEIPTNVNMLILIHPKQLSEQTLYAIDQFVLRGGKMLAFTDPLCLADQEASAQQYPGAEGNASDLNRLTKAWGAEMQEGDVVADLEAGSTITRDYGVVERSPIWLSLRDNNLARQEAALSSLRFIMMPFAGAFRLSSVPGVVPTVLIRTSSGAGWVSTSEAMKEGAAVMQSFQKQGELPLAVRLQGNFPSAFPAGPPRVPETKEGEQHKATVAMPLKASIKPGIVVLVADADMLYDRFSVRSGNYMGQSFVEPSNDNISFALNLVEQLTGSEALIGLRSRGAYDRPFHRVNELERHAQERWQQEELRLQAKLEQSQARLNELQNVKSQDQKYILSPEQKQEIDQFRKESIETQRQLKEVRKNLRREIDSLGLRLKVINMALVPLGVAVFGLVHGWRRRRRAVS